jgi:hypothetical protein
MGFATTFGIITLALSYTFGASLHWVDALRDVSEARKLHRKMTELDPGFIDASSRRE